MGATRHTQEELIMIDEEMNWPFANRSDELDRMALPADIGQTIAAFMAITKSEWMSQEHASPVLDEMTADGPRFAHSLFGIDWDEKHTGY